MHKPDPESRTLVIATIPTEFGDIAVADLSDSGRHGGLGPVAAANRVLSRLRTEGMPAPTGPAQAGLAYLSPSGVGTVHVCRGGSLAVESLERQRAAMRLIVRQAAEDDMPRWQYADWAPPLVPEPDLVLDELNALLIQGNLDGRVDIRAPVVKHREIPGQGLLL